MTDAYQVVRRFEKEIANYAGSNFAVAVESGTAAIFLSLQYRTKVGGYTGKVVIPSHTYPSVACSVINSGLKVEFDKDWNWRGIYDLKPIGIIDSALRFTKGMYEPGTLYCLSFHAKKHLPIGRGGMILTDDPKAAQWLKLARFDGREERPLNETALPIVGWNMYMTPEQAARGLMLFQSIKKNNEDLDFNSQGYPDLSKVEAYRCHLTT